MATKRKPTVWRSPPLYWSGVDCEWQTRETCGCSTTCTILLLTACEGRIADEFVGVTKRKPIVLVVSTKPVRGSVFAPYRCKPAADALGGDGPCFWWVEQ